MIDLTRLLPKLLRANPELAVKLAWARAAGTGLRYQAVPLRLEGGTFIVSVADAIWQKQLQSMSAELIFRLNNLLAQRIVDELVFRINPPAVSHAQAGAEQSLPEVAPAPAPTELLFAAGSIADQELRARFIRAAENCIARRDSRITSE
jgi:Dna[CI] antecedent, DciA